MGSWGKEGAGTVASRGKKSKAASSSTIRLHAACLLRPAAQEGWDPKLTVQEGVGYVQ